MKFKQLLFIVVISVLSAFGGVYIYGKFFRGASNGIGTTMDGKLPVNYASFFDNNGNAADPTDFTKASQSAVPAVVHIKTKIPARKLSNDLPNSESRGYDPFEDFFGDMFGGMGPQMIPEQRASGSGVIISQDGYIVTNNHVISDRNGKDIAPEIKVTLNEGRKTYTAKVVGRDPSTDLAVLKIEAINLPYLIYGNSDNLQLGQWVLAVGYPFNLEATVTAGIISAKGRSIGINSQQSQSPVESFIQTDAAVNSGNSGGALINTNGELIGINSAILAPGGTYAGYSFAIPSSIVKKIVNDIVKYGDVKRGYLGVTYSSQPSQNEEYLKRANVQDGVYVMGTDPDGGAGKAGIKRGDIITKLNGNQIVSGLEISGAIASAQPGDKVKITYIRNGKENTVDVVLSAQSKIVQLSSAEAIADRLGVDLKNVSGDRAEQLRIKGGVEVTNIRPDGPFKKTRMEKGFIITSVNGQEVKSMDEFAQTLSQLRSSVIALVGIYPGYSGRYTYQINLAGDEGGGAF
ncbi:trypsin-like peptidase domain-containing protein [Niabella insulamsoli]|uniref:trypsin-like peptidase domain-containing protein n=1 Tax=Niabella insulamsoli TaxID=3144874 RepID=UPI0031FC4B6A